MVIFLINIFVRGEDEYARLVTEDAWLVIEDAIPIIEVKSFSNFFLII